MGTTEHHGAADAIAEPLLPSSTVEVEPAPPRRNMFAFVCATLASMTTILMGYNLALMSGAELFMRDDLGLTDEQVEVLSGSMNMFMLASILAAGWAADAIGRRGTVVIANAFLMASALAMSLGGSFASLMAARFVTSVGVGFAVVVAPVYAAEIAPASSRGLLSSLVDFFITAGILLSYVSNYALAGLPLRLGWRAMFALGVPPPLLLAAGVLAMPESPRWLAMRGCDDEARAVLERTSDAPAEARDRLEEIRRAVAAQVGGAGVWRELFVRPSPMVRRILANVLVLYSFQQASGIDAIVLYTPLVFKKAGISSTSAVLAATVAVGLVKTLSIFVATFLSDRVGRRPLLLASAAGIAVTLTSLGIALLCAGAGAGETTPTPAVAAACVASVLAFVTAFSIGLGPLAPTYSAEILPLQLRAQGMSLGIAANRVTCSIISMTFISLANSITMAGCFFLYASTAVAAAVFVYVRLPETKGRSLEDIGVLFAK
ncbi:polyol transporter 5-like [Miscanthus floridulus]|uniref:polyol transporter 5-like n=1 Tax=Miscanthus floridulus TaxID=154761 RepID=UPI003459A879